MVLSFPQPKFSDRERIAPSPRGVADPVRGLSSLSWGKAPQNLPAQQKGGKYKEDKKISVRRNTAGGPPRGYCISSYACRQESSGSHAWTMREVHRKKGVELRWTGLEKKKLCAGVGPRTIRNRDSLLRLQLGGGKKLRIRSLMGRDLPWTKKPRGYEHRGKEPSNQKGRGSPHVTNWQEADSDKRFRTQPNRASQHNLLGKKGEN